MSNEGTLVVQGQSGLRCNKCGAILKARAPGFAITHRGPVRAGETHMVNTPCPDRDDSGMACLVLHLAPCGTWEEIGDA